MKPNHASAARASSWISFAMVVAGVLLAAAPADAHAVEVMSTALPSGRSDTSAVWDGTNAYIFGGYDGGSLDEIVRYSPATDAVTTMSALPSGRSDTSAVWDGTNAYIFGGNGIGTGYVSQIVRYNPATDTVTTIGLSALPSGRSDTSAVWDGTYAYIFGGSISGGSGKTNQILRYHPATNAVTTLAATLPTARHSTSAIWDGTAAYIFGGVTTNGYTNQIVKFVPATGSVTVLSGTINAPRSHTSAVWDGTAAYLFGGYYTGNDDSIMKFSPATGTAAYLPLHLPSGRSAPSAVWDGVNAYVFGGFGPGGPELDEIVRFNPTEPDVPSDPWGLAAAPDGAGRIKLTWHTPSHADGGILSYRIYRGESSGAQGFLTTVDGTALTFTDSGLPNSATRYYTVTAVNVVGEGERSNEASATTPTTPSPPQNLLAVAQPLTVGHIRLSWTAAANDGGLSVTGYNIYRSTTPGGEAFFDSAGNALSYTDDSCPLLTTCYYQVTAVNASGEGPRSNEDSATWPV